MFNHLIPTTTAISYGCKYQVWSKDFISARPGLPGNRIIRNQNIGIFIPVPPLTLRKSFSNLGPWFADLDNKHNRCVFQLCNFMTILSRHVVLCIQNAELVRTF